MVHEGEYSGTVSVHRLLQYLTDAKLSSARQGHATIHEEVKNRLRSGHPFSAIFVDLNYFKAFNDAYGYERDDQVLLFTAKLLTHIAQHHGGERSFAGHIGGDDFVLLLGQDRAGDFCRKLIRAFDRLAPRFHGPEERKFGRMIGCDRSGRRVALPLLSIAVGGLHVPAGSSLTPDEVSRRAANAKQLAKEHCGSYLAVLPAATPDCCELS